MWHPDRVTSPSLPPAAKAADTTRDNPWPLRRLTENIKKYVDRMSPLWVEGQVVEFKRRPGAKMHFLTLRDLQTDTSMTVTAWAGVMDQAGDGLQEGARVVTRVKPVFWERTGRLNLQAAEIHLQGVGSLLAQIEALRQRLAAEGLFNESRKKPLPFLPRVIGLVCGRAAKAEDDVVVNASDRWPGARFEIREVAVQGDRCVAEWERLPCRDRRPRRLPVALGLPVARGSAVPLAGEPAGALPVGVRDPRVAAGASVCPAAPHDDHHSAGHGCDHDDAHDDGHDDQDRVVVRAPRGVLADGLVARRRRRARRGPLVRRRPWAGRGP